MTEDLVTCTGNPRSESSTMNAPTDFLLRQVIDCRRGFVRTLRAIRPPRLRLSSFRGARGRLRIGRGKKRTRHKSRLVARDPFRNLIVQKNACRQYALRWFVYSATLARAQNPEPIFTSHLRNCYIRFDVFQSRSGTKRESGNARPIGRRPPPLNPRRYLRLSAFVISPNLSAVDRGRQRALFSSANDIISRESIFYNVIEKLIKK